MMTRKWIRCLAGVGLALGSCGLSGCITEPGRTGPALWSSVSRKGDEDTPSRLKHPVRTSVLAGQIAERQRRYAVARQHYERALKHNSRSVEAIVGLARLDQHDGRFAQAQRGFEKALQMAPEDPNVLYSAGLFYAARQQWPQALRYLQRAVQSVPNNADYHYGLGVVLAKTGDMNGALTHFRTAVGPANAHYNLGHLLYEQGRLSEAARQFEIALTLNPDLIAARQMLARLHNGSDLRRNPPQISHSAGYPATGRNFGRPNTSPVRSVGHLSGPRDLGSQSAWENRQPAITTVPQQSSPNGIRRGAIVSPGHPPSSPSATSSARAGANTLPPGDSSGNVPLWPQRQ